MYIEIVVNARHDMVIFFFVVVVVAAVVVVVVVVVAFPVVVIVAVFIVDVYLFDIHSSTKSKKQTNNLGG